jgi:hypothetical protein
MVKKTKDWLRRGRQDLYEQAVLQTVPYLNNNIGRFGMETTTSIGRWYAEEFIAKAYNSYVAAYSAWENPVLRTRSSIITMNTAMITFTTCYRQLYRYLKANPAVNDTDLANMGFPVRSDSKRSPAPITSDSPAFTIIPLLNHRISIDNYPIGDDQRKSIPKGQHGAEIK